jgi:hypothetical protein
MNQRGESSSTAIVAIVVLVLVGLFVFMTFFRGGRSSTAGVNLPDKVNVEVKPGAAGGQ